MSRMRYISSQTELPIRFVGLSTALANAVDLADWLGIPPSVRPTFSPSPTFAGLACMCTRAAGVCSRVARHMRGDRGAEVRLRG